MTTSSDYFPTDTSGLQEARPAEAVELADGDGFDFRIAPVAKRLGGATVRAMARPEGDAELRTHQAHERMHEEGIALARPKALDGAHHGTAHESRVGSRDRVVLGRPRSAPMDLAPTPASPGGADVGGLRTGAPGARPLQRRVTAVVNCCSPRRSDRDLA